jgi:cytochrome c oxidase cbb3-type subunit IV
MIRKYLTSGEMMNLYPIISLVLFFSFFVLMLIWVIRKNKAYVRHMEMLPLADAERSK